MVPTRKYGGTVICGIAGMTNKNFHEIKKKLCNHASIQLIFINENDWMNDMDSVKALFASVFNSRLDW